jgi:hypothetical protein
VRFFFIILQSKVSMVRCTVELANGVNIADKSYNSTYLPFSVSTLKFRVSNQEEELTEVTMTPQNYYNNDEYCCGFDDNTKQLKISWGGGNEEGAIVSLEPYVSKYVYLFVHHESDQLSHYDLTLNVRKITGGFGEKILENDSIKIRLSPLKDEKGIVHQKFEGDGQTLTYEGELICSYYPRWFPEEFQNLLMNKNEYYAGASIPAHQLVLERKSEGHSADRIIVKFGNIDNIIAEISGDMDGSSFHSDLFRFNENSFVIRLWFFWLSKKQFNEGKNLQTIRADKQSGIFNPELPDSERYDLLVSNTGKLLSIGTDFHWQEYWYGLKNASHMVGRIAKYLHPVDESLTRLINRLSKIVVISPTDYSSILNSLKKFSQSDQLEPHIMTSNYDGTFIESLLDKESSEIERQAGMRKERWRNLIRSHVPYVRNGSIICDMISREVQEI